VHNPEFAAYAQLCGAHGERVLNADELDGAVARAFAYDGPAVVEVVTDPELV
jgi:thiamine pyrophosphate-dependent acetolactate synthase large subunit-like protein